jgi:hypothetical protein
VTRQYAGDDRLSRICGVFVFTVAFIGASCGNHTGKAAVSG